MASGEQQQPAAEEAQRHALVDAGRRFALEFEELPEDMGNCARRCVWLGHRTATAAVR